MDENFPVIDEIHGYKIHESKQGKHRETQSR